MGRLLALGIMLAGFGSAHDWVSASTRFVQLQPEPRGSGWIETAPDGTNCVPQPVQPSAGLNVGRRAETACGIRRSFLTFSLEHFAEAQIAAAELVFYQGVPEAGADAGSRRIKVELVNLGDDLEPADWTVAPADSVMLPAGPTDRQAEYRTDVTRWISFLFEALHRDLLQVRISMEGEATAAGIIPLEGPGALAGLQPRLEVYFADEIASPLSLTMTGSQFKAGDAFGDTFLGLALVNPNPVSNRIQSRLWSQDGQLVLHQDRGTLAGFGQQALVVQDSPGADYQSIRGNWGVLQGFFIGGDNRLRKQDGIGSELVAAKELYFSLAERTAGSTTRVFLFRTGTTLSDDVTVPGSADDSDLQLELMDRQGNVVETASQPLGTRGFRVFDLETRFAASAQGDYLRVRSGLPTRGYAMTIGPATLRAAAGRPALPARRLYLPHFALSRTDDTIVQLLNPDTGSVTAKFTIHREQGAPVVVSAEVAGRGMLVAPVSELLDLDRSTLPPAQLISGWAQVEFQAQAGGLPEVLGTATLGRQDLYETSLPLPAEGQRETLVLHVAQSNDLRIFTGLALLNPGSEPALVRVQMVHPAGTVTRESHLEIDGGKRRLGLLSDEALFGGDFQQTGGHLRILSNRPIVVFSIFGDFDLRYYSAIEAQVPATRPRGFRELRGQCQENAGPVVIWGSPDPREGTVNASRGQVTLRFRFWDGSRVLGPLGFWANGVNSVDLEAVELLEAGVTAVADLEPTGSLNAADTVLRLTVPEQVAGTFPIRLQVSDVEDCDSTLEFLLLLD